MTRGGSGKAETPETIPLRWRAALGLLRRLPQGLLSRGTGWLAERPIPRVLRRPILGAFVAATGIDLGEAEGAIEDYGSVSELFTRRLRGGARRWPEGADVPASPVDGVVGAVGPIREGGALQAKGRPYSVAELLGSVEEAHAFKGGGFLTIYLSPRHYHRIHVPLGGALRWARAIPGALLPVNAPAVAGVPELFPRNERLVATLDAPSGRVALVAVGAFNVGRISAAFDPEWNGPDGRGVTNLGRRRGPELREYRPPLEMNPGDEFMAFHLGSTVVLLFDAEVLRGRTLHPDLVEGREIRLGAPLLSDAKNPPTGSAGPHVVSPRGSMV